MADGNTKTVEIPAEPFYPYSEEAHAEMRNVQDCMFLLCLLTQSRLDDPMIPFAQWSSFFHLIGTHMRDVLNGVQWHEGV